MRKQAWKKRKSGTARQRGKAFPIMPSMQRMKSRLPKVQVKITQLFTKGKPLTRSQFAVILLYARELMRKGNYGVETALYKSLKKYRKLSVPIACKQRLYNTLVEVKGRVERDESRKLRKQRMKTGMKEVEYYIIKKGKIVKKKATVTMARGRRKEKPYMLRGKGKEKLRRKFLYKGERYLLREIRDE